MWTISYFGSYEIVSSFCPVTKALNLLQLDSFSNLKSKFRLSEPSLSESE